MTPLALVPRRRLLHLLVVLPLVAAWAALSPWDSAAAEGKTVRVEPGTDYRPLVARLAPGDELVFLPGTHERPAQLRVEGTADAPIVLRGERDAEGNRPRLVYAGRDHNLWRLAGRHVVVRGLEFHATHAYGIRVDAAENVTIEDCVFRDCGGGDLSANSAPVDGLAIRGCLFAGGRATPLYIGNHDGRLAVRGFLFENNVIDGSRIETGVGYGIQLKLNVAGGVIRRNLIGGTRGPGIMVYGHEQADPELANRVEGNLVFGARQDAGIEVGAGPSVVRDNVVLACPGGGIRLSDYGGRGLMRLVEVSGNTVGLNERFDIALRGKFEQVVFRNNLVLGAASRAVEAALAEVARGEGNRLAAAPAGLGAAVERLAGRLAAFDPAQLEARWPKAGPIEPAELLDLLAVLAGDQAASPAEEKAATPASDLVPLGAARIDITPETPVRMYGYGARQTESEGVAGRLSAKALAIGGDEGEGPAVLLCVDCGAVPVRVWKEVLRRVAAKVKVQPERFVLANSHCHSGPDLAGYERLPEEHKQHMGQYMDHLTDRLERVVLDAIGARRPGRLAWARGSVGFAANRRVLKEGRWAAFGAVPDGPVDHSLSVLRAADADGRLLAVVANYACHCTTLRGNFTQIHGDWAASAQGFIEAEHPGAAALITIGCGSDADPCPHGTVELCDQHGRALADEVKRLLAGPMTPIEPALIARRTILRFPYQVPPSEEELDERAASSWRLKQVLEGLKRGEQPPPIEYPITVWAFGDDLAMVFLTSEVVVDYALRMAREMDADRLWISAYAHEVAGYVVSRRIIREGGYEANNSLSARVSFGRPETVEPPIEDRILGAVRELLPEGYLRP